MKTFICIIAIIFCRITNNAQTEFWGITPSGGLYNAGVIFKTDGSGNNQTVEHNFFQIEGGLPKYTRLLQATDGMFYGMTTEGGVNNDGILFQYDPVNNIYTKKYDFAYSTNGHAPENSLMQASDGKLYGTITSGGVYSEGVLFQFDPVTNIFIKKADFSASIIGAYPMGTLIQALDGNLYGMTAGGGANNKGIIFLYDLIADTVIKRKDLGGLVEQPVGSLIQDSDGKLYGLTRIGGVFNKGVLFQYNPLNDSLIKKIDFNGISNGMSPYGSLIKGIDGDLYGMTTYGGINNLGTLFQYNSTTNTLIKKIDFDGTTKGSNPYGSLVQASDGNLYGLTNTGGINNLGGLFQYDPIGNTLNNKYSFFWVDGQNPYGSLMQATDGKLYGMTYSGGENFKGTLFQYDFINNSFNKKFDFQNAENGINAFGSLVQASDGNLYGLAYKGGVNNLGTLFQYNPVTHVFSKKFDFDGISNGAKPRGSLIETSNGNLFGMTTIGGADDNGVLFQFNYITNIYSKLFDFGNSNGIQPYGDLLKASDGKLYGLTSDGGGAYYGTLFQFDPTTSIFTKKIDFTQALGNTPFGSVIQASDGMLYGMTQYGTSGLFQFDPVTDNFLNKYNFNFATGISPTGSLVQAINGKLYGLTAHGGINDEGVLFEYDIPSNTYTMKIDFDATTTGYAPKESLLMATDGNLYGCTLYGGVNNCGTLFRYNPINSLYTKTIDFTVLSGGSTYGHLIEAPATITHTKENNIINNFSIYPNPNNGLFTIELTSKSQITITNILGETILNQSLEKGKQDLSIQSQTAGFYFVKVTDAKGVSATKKIVVTN